jgi:hypothetical protein
MTAVYLTPRQIASTYPSNFSTLLAPLLDLTVCQVGS